MTTKRITLGELKSLVKRMINESMAYNDAGEPMMTHRQYMDYSEPSEPDFDDTDNNQGENIEKWLSRELKENDILLETFNGNEYFIRCKTYMDFLIYFINDDEIKIHLNDESDQEITEVFSPNGALNYILKNKNWFLSFDESIKDINQEYEIERHDKLTQRMGG